MFRLFILLFLLATIVNSYKLTGRTLHTANYQNEKIYFLGGITETANYTNDLFYLDVSIPFTLDSLPIFDLSSNIQIAKHAKATSTEPLIFAFNISVPQWTNANISGLEPVRRSWSSAACNKYAKMYIFAATATMLSDGKIVFLGGQGNYNISRSIDIYDTNNDKWSQMIPNGTPPQKMAVLLYMDLIKYTPSLARHTATLVGNYMVIAFGLIYKDNKYVFSNQILLLDVSDKNDYKWVTNFTPNTTALESSTNEHTPLLD
ncbi:19513_t:CDS:2 [Funneliformis geosporum]|nr:19513_t:CDS:2 [Funneliformis geosporum]